LASLLTVAGTLGAHEAGGHGQLRGQVVDETQGGPIAGVPVRVAGTELSALTDEHGTFVFPSVPAGPLVLLVDGPVVAPVRLTLAEPRPTGPLVITAAYAATAEVDVTVTGARPAPTAASTRRLTRHELQAAPRRTAEDALRLVPGLTVVQHGSEGKGHQFFLRGFDAVHGADLALSVGGAPVNEWSNIHAQGYVDLGFVIPEIVDSVTVIKGPFSLDQGAFAMAGSADYELGVAAEDRGLRTSFGVGTTYRHRSLISYSPRRGNGRDFVASEVVHDDGFGQRRHIDRVGLLGQHRLLDAPRQGTLTLMTAASLARFELPGTVRNDDVEAGRIGFYDAYDHQSRGLSGRGLVALSYRWEGDGHQVRATVHGGIRRLELRENYTGYLVDPIHGDARAQEQDAHQLGSRFAYYTDLHPAVALQVGGGFRGDMLDQRQDHVDRLGTPLERDRELSGHQSITHGRAGLEVGPLRALRLVGGARVDVAHVDVRDGLADDASQGGTRVAVSPRAIALWRVMDGWSLSAAYGRGFRPPEARASGGRQPRP